jgi:hypothetical protein
MGWFYEVDTVALFGEVNLSLAPAPTPEMMLFNTPIVLSLNPDLESYRLLDGITPELW